MTIFSLFLSSMLSSADWNIEVGYIENLNHKNKKESRRCFSGLNRKEFIFHAASSKRSCKCSQNELYTDFDSPAIGGFGELGG